MTANPSRARIGITPDVGNLGAPDTEYMVRCNYADAVLHRGGLPLVLPYHDDVAGYLGLIDGLLVTGGMFDIDPALYRQTARSSYVTKPTRTAFEKALIDGALEAGIPVLGICNGMQLLAVCLGGQLIQDVRREVRDALEHKSDKPATVAQHEIRGFGTSRSLPAMSSSRCWVNSVHHQAVLPSASYRTIAAATDGVIEAIEAIDHSFAVGVQWHLEYMGSEIDDAILRGFVAAATERSSWRSAAIDG